MVIIFREFFFGVEAMMVENVEKAMLVGGWCVGVADFSGGKR